MPAIQSIETSVRTSTAPRIRVAAWNRRLLMAATLLVLIGATTIALYAAGPHARAMIAGEGALYTDPQ